MKRSIFISTSFLLICLSSQPSKAQTNIASTYLEYDSLINVYSESNEFEKLVLALKTQFSFIAQNNLNDSLYRYTYKYGRAYSELAGPKSGISKTEAFVSQIIANDSNRSHQLQAINDLSWIYIEAGNDSMCFITDLRYRELCDSYPKASAEERFIAYYSLGFDYELQGKAPQAISHFNTALSAVLEDSLKYLNQIMDGYNGLGAAYWRNGNFNKAKDAFNESIRYSTNEKDSLAAYMYQANAYGNLSLIYQDEGDLVKSKELLEHSISIRKKSLEVQTALHEKPQQLRHLIRNYHNLASLYLTLGDFERSKKAEQYCAKLRLENLPENHPDHAKSLEAYGSIEYALGNYENALSYYSEGIEKLKKGLGEFSPYVITIHQRLGKTYHALGDTANAQDHFTKAIEALKQMADPTTSQDLAMAYLARSKSLYDFGRVEGAKKDLQLAERIFNKTRESHNPIFGNIYLDLGRNYLKQNQIDSAHYYIDRAIDTGKSETRSYSAKQNNTINYLPHAYAAKAELLSQGESHQLEQALGVAIQGKNILQDTRGEYAEDFSQLTLYDHQSSIFDIGINVAFDLYQRNDKAEKYLNTLFQLAEESKSILLRNQLNKFSSLRVSGIPDSLLVRENELLKSINGMNSGDTPETIFKAEKDYDKLLTLFKNSYPEYFKLRYQEKVATIAELQSKLLKPNQNLVEYVLTNSRAFAIVINPKNAVLIELESSELNETIKSFNSLITSHSPQLMAVSENLYKQLFLPLEPYLIGSNIKLVPDEALFNINFETLIRPGENDASPNYLIYDYTFSYLLSATTALQFNELDKVPNHKVLAIAPGFNDEMKAEYLSQIDDSVFIDQQYLNSIQQPFAVMAAQDVANIFSGKALLNTEATEENFKNLVSNYAILHLGTHTEINNLSPLMSKFILSKEFDSDNTQDGYLHAYEIYKLALRAELAVLTACETGLGKQTSSEGVLSIAHSFAYAGCPSIVMSIWQIDEKTSTEITSSFYKNLKAGKAKDEALREAKLKYLKENNGELSHPYYWSGLILVGNTQAIQNEISFSWFWAILTISTLLLLAYLFRQKQNDRV